MRIKNRWTNEYKTISYSKLEEIDFLKYETRNHNGKQVVMRVWYDGWFPLNPVEGLDIRAKQERPKHNRVLEVRYKG